MPQPTVNDKIADRYIAHRTWLLGEEQRTVREVLAIIRRGRKQAVGELATIYERFLARIEDTGEPLEPWTPRGMKTHVRAIRAIEESLGDAVTFAKKPLLDRLTGIATKEQEAWRRALERSIPDPVLDELKLFRVPERQLLAMVKDQFGDRLEGSAATLADDLRQVEATTMRKVNAAIEDGMRDGEGIDAMVRRVNRTLGDDEAFEHDTAAVVRQQVIRTANDVSSTMSQENADIVGGEQYVATLDAATCPICGPLDGEVFEIGKGPRPPRHPNCRCIMTPVVKGWDELGLPPALKEKYGQALDGKPAAKVSWSDWVQRNPERMGRVLGPTRAAAVIAGKISLSDLSTTTFAKTLDELGLERR